MKLKTYLLQVLPFAASALREPPQPLTLPFAKGGFEATDLSCFQQSQYGDNITMGKSVGEMYNLLDSHFRLFKQSWHVARHRERSRGCAVLLLRKITHNRPPRAYGRKKFAPRDGRITNFSPAAAPREIGSPACVDLAEMTEIIIGMPRSKRNTGAPEEP